MKRLPGLASFILFVALCASAAYWFLQLWRPPVRAVAAPVTVAVNDVPMDAAAGLFGGRPAPVGVASNYQLRGVVVAANGRESVAILSADGKPAQAIGLNTEFQPGVTVREVHPQYVLLSENGVVKRVALPEGARGGGADTAAGAMPSMPSMPMAQPMPVQPMPQLQPIQPLQPPSPQPSMQPQPSPQLTPQLTPVPQATQLAPPVIGQMSTQLSQPVPGQVNALGQQVVPTGQPANPAGMQPTIPTPSGGIGGYSQPRRQ